MPVLEFSTKAKTLATLLGNLNSARILPLEFFTVEEWRINQESCLSNILDTLGDGPFIVRSSCVREDSVEGSNAGAFLTLLDVSTDQLTNSVDDVISSYGTSLDSDEILIQPMLTDLVRSGVAFSHDPHTKGPYRVITWREGDDTTGVTGGLDGRTWQSAALSRVEPPSEIKPVVALIDELLDLYDSTPLDCEFAITSSPGETEQVLWLLQARPLAMDLGADTPETQAERLATIAEKVERGMQPNPFLMGKRTVYGVMPDWNPAEIIGIRPKPLALSLYRDLITDAIWAYQRGNYGYRNLRSFPLMPHFLGVPYIDVRLSFNSFIPADLDDDIANRLVDYYVDRLLAEPNLHDKIEFEIVFSCYTFDLPERLKALEKAGFSESEREAIANSLRNLTNNIVHPDTGLWQEDAAKLDILKERRETLATSNLDTLERIYWLLEDAKRYGTLPFAGLARAGFVAVQMLQSMVDVGVLTESDYDAFMASVTTVSGRLAQDRNTLDRDSFLERYGHLRPGTYDILSPRYDEVPDLYFDWSENQAEPEPIPEFSLSETQMQEVVRLSKEHGLHLEGEELFAFLRAGIELRELSKFHFTRNLSDAISLLAKYGDQNGFSAEDMAYCDIKTLQELHIAAADPTELLTAAIETGKARYQETLSIALPPVITSPDDVWGFEWPVTVPNFITQRQVTAPVTNHKDRTKLEGAIVCIPNADPGFDWLFSYPIAGLITAWGGANSHMAIRASELSLPSVIGAGEVFFRRWSGAERLHLDCAGRRVEILQ
jgi:phosphohistidine swiveling domain-containing protein